MVQWQNINEIESRQFKCKYCGSFIATAAGYFRNHTSWRIYICSHCERPTFFEGDKQNPSPIIGDAVENIPEDIKQLYDEARENTGIGAYTSAVLACRKMLMHIAVEQGAKPGKNFVEYVEYLSGKGFVPPNGKQWVDHIRSKGNEANHEIVLMGEKDALELIDFIEMLLKFIYEFPEKFKKISE